MTAPQAHRPTIAVTRHAISAGHYLAATAGFAILEAGGNAIDAGCAAGIALGVLQSDLVDVAGVAPIMIYDAASREVITIAGLGPWPKALDPELFMREHGGKIPKGVIRTVVPAAPDAWITALRRYGTMSFGEVAAAAIRLAGDGFPMYPLMAAEPEATRRRPPRLAILGGDLSARRPAARSRRLFRQTDLAGSLQYMADEERAAAGRGARGRARSRPRRLLSRRHRKEDRRLHERRGRAAVGRGSGRVPLADRPAGAAPVWRSRSLHLRRVVPGTGIAADPGPAGGDRPCRARPQQRRLRPPPDRGVEARLCRPRGLLRRPGAGRGAAGDPDLRGICRRAAKADPPRPGLAGNATAREARRRDRPQHGGFWPAPLASPTPSPTPPMSALPTVTAICSRRRRATAPTARRWCRGPGSSRPIAARSRAPTRAIRPVSPPASGRG